MQQPMQKAYLCYLLIIMNSFSPACYASITQAEKTPQASPKVLVAIFGVLSRSIRYTWPQINKMIVLPLAKNYEVDIYILDNQLDNIDQLDGHPIQKSHAGSIPYPGNLIYDTKQQSQLDATLQTEYADHDLFLQGLYAKQRENCGNEKRCQRWEKTIFNAKRQLLQEQLVSDHLKKLSTQYDFVVAVNTDIYPLLPLNPLQIREAIATNPNTILTSPKTKNMKTAKVATNGFYIGTQQAVACTMSMLETAQKVVPITTSMPYEGIVATTIEHHQLKQMFADLHFCKMRNSNICTMHGYCHYGKDCNNHLENYYDDLSDTQRQTVLKELSQVQIAKKWNFNLSDLKKFIAGLSNYTPDLS
jgi:hypothetical protein